MDVASDGGDDKDGGLVLLALDFLGEHVGFEVGDGLFHDTGALDDLGEEHLAGSEKLADDLHAVHEGALDDLERLAEGGAGLLGVLLDVVGDAADEGMGHALEHGALAPAEVGSAVFISRLSPGGLELLGVVDEGLGRAGIAVQEDVLDEFLELRLDLVVDLEHAGIDDAHVHARPSGVVEEGRVHGLAHDVVAAEAEGDIGDPTADFGAGEILLDPARRVDEVDGVIVVLVHPRGDGEDVGIEDDVLGVEADLVDEDAVGALADADFFLKGGGLALLVEGHDHDGGAVLHDGAGVRLEDFFAFLERDGIDDAFALEAFQPGLDDGPFRRVDHDGHGGDVGFSGEEIEETGHHFGSVDHALVHADVDDRRAVLDLLTGDGDGFLEFVLFDELREFGRTGHVGALADHEEALFVGVVVSLGSAEAQVRLGHGDLAGSVALRDAGDRGDVGGGVAAAASDEVDEAGLGETGDLALHVVGEEVEAGRGEGIGQSGVRVDGDVGRSDAGELGEVRLHEVGPERAVQPDGKGLGMGHGVPERLGLLRRDHRFPAASDRSRDDDGELDAVFVEDFAQGDEGGLGIEGIEDGLDHHDVGPARDEGADLVFVGDEDLIKGDDPESGVLGIGRVREGDGHGSDGPGDVAFPPGLIADAVAPLAREFGGLVVDLPGEFLEEGIVADLAGEELGVLAADALFARVFDEKFALGKGRAGESVRLDDV